MTYNLVREDTALRTGMADVAEGMLAPVEEEAWAAAVTKFLDHYPYDCIPCPDTMIDPPKELPQGEIRANLKQMCQKAERTHRFRRYLLANREIKRWAVWLDIGCRAAFTYPEHPRLYRQAVEVKDRGW